MDVRSKPKLISLFLIVMLCIAAKKADPIVVPVAGEHYLTLKDLDEIKVMFFGYLVGLCCWLLKTLYEMFIKKNDSTENKVSDLIDSFNELNGKMDRMIGRLDQFATKAEVHDTINNKIEFYDRIRKNP